MTILAAARIPAHMEFLVATPTLRFILPSLLLWILWFSAKTSDEQRARMLSGIIGCYAATLSSRFGQVLVFVHTRPILSRLPVKIAPGIDIAGWSRLRRVIWGSTFHSMSWLEQPSES
jgi:hypothetical protein